MVHTLRNITKMQLASLEALRLQSLVGLFRSPWRRTSSPIPASPGSFSGLEAQSLRRFSVFTSPPSPEVYHNRAAEMTVWKCPLWWKLNGLCLWDLKFWCRCWPPRVRQEEGKGFEKKPFHWFPLWMEILCAVLVFSPIKWGRIPPSAHLSQGTVKMN